MPTPTLETPRLHLRPYAPEDEDWAAALLGDPEVMRHVGGGPRPVEEARAVFGRVFSDVYARDRWEIWAVMDRATGEPLGHAELKPGKDVPDHEIVYFLRRTAWGKGLATELARALIERGLAKGLPRVAATIAPENAASQRVAEKAGMRFVERLSFDDGDALVYVADA